MDRSDHLRELHFTLVKSARRWTSNPASAEDLAQDTWLAVLAASDDPATRPAGWLLRTLRNKAVDAIRAKARRPAVSSATADGQSAEGEGESLERSEVVHSIAQRLLRIPARYREILLMRYFDGLAPSEIGRRLGVPTETVRTRTRRGLQRLRELGVRQS